MSKLSDCIINKKVSGKPIWFMRQAGRYLPEFRKIRSENKDFIKLCLNPDLVREITLQPINRFKLDAAIIFSDILIIPYGLNQKVEFKKGHGPILGEIDIEKIINCKESDFVERVYPVYKGIKKTKEKLKIRFPKTPKQGILFLRLSEARYLANFVSTTVYKIIVFFFPLYSFRTLSICCSVLIKTYSFLSYSKLAN